MKRFLARLPVGTLPVGFSDAAAANQIRDGRVSTIRIEESGAAIGVSVKVPGAEAPWLGLASRGGQVSEVRYTGSEGAH